MFLKRFSYENSYFMELVYDSSVFVLMIYSFKNVLKGFALDFLFFWGLAVGVYIACPLRYATIDLLFISKILIFEAES